jgi:hypothetical protein
MERHEAGIICVCSKFLVSLPIELSADFYVFLREVVSVDEDFADLVGVFDILVVMGCSLACRVLMGRNPETSSHGE